MSLKMHLNHGPLLNITSGPLGCPRKEGQMRKLATLLLAGTLGVGFGVRALADENEKGHEHQSVTMADLPLTPPTTRVLMPNRLSSQGRAVAESSFSW